jgi:hypothetical protein
VTADILGGQSPKQDAVDWRVQALYTWVFMVTPTDEAALEVNVDKFCRDAVSERQAAGLGLPDDSIPPFTMSVVDGYGFRIGQLLRSIEGRGEAGGFQYSTSLRDTEPTIHDRRGSASRPGCEAMLVILDPVRLCAVVVHGHFYSVPARSAKHSSEDREVTL